MHRLTRHRMREVERQRMERLPRDGERRGSAAVLRIADERMADAREVHADLMRAARLESALDECVVTEALQHAKMRDGRLAARDDGHALAVLRAPADGPLDRAGLLPDVAVHDGPIDAARRLRADLLGEVYVRAVILGRHHDARRVLVEAMHDARTDDAVDAGEFKASLTPLMRSAEYDIELEFDESVPREAFYAAVDEILNGGEIIVSKKTKGGIKDVDIRPMLLGLSVSEFGGRTAKLRLRGKLTAEGGLSPELLLGAFYKKLGTSANSSVNRRNIEMDWTVIA